MIIVDVVWHRLSAHRDIKRDEEAEKRTIQREEAFEIREIKRGEETERRAIKREQDLEERQIRRERQETLRKHWQELQPNLISLNRVASHMAQLMQFVEKNKDTKDPTTRLPVVLSDFGDYWGRAVAQLNVFPQPRDVLALEVLAVIDELGKSLRDSNVEVKDETLQALSELARRVSDPAALPSLDA